MAINNPYQQYQQNSVNTATPEELTLMLYNGAIKFINIAKVHMEEKNIQETNTNLIKAQRIIEELNGTLDMKYDVSKELRALYTFIRERLIDANIQKDIKILDEILPIVEEMRNTWKLAMEEAKKQRVLEGAK